MLVLVLTVSGCNSRPNNDNTVLSNGGDSAPPQGIIENSKAVNAQLQINYATDEIKGRHESFHEFVHEEEGAWLLIETDVSIKHFNLIKIEHKFTESNIVFFVDGIEYSLDELTTETPFLVKTYSSYGTIPRHGVSYMDSDNITRYFYISESGMDGSLSFVEFENDND
jgi:hypothetical protein